MSASDNGSKQKIDKMLDDFEDSITSKFDKVNEKNVILIDGIQDVVSILHKGKLTKFNSYRKCLAIIDSLQNTINRIK